MGPVEVELREFARRRRALTAEVALCVTAAAALLAVAPLMDSARCEAQAIFVLACALFGVCCTSLVPRTIPVLLFRCPRCRKHFHGGEPRAGRFPASWRCCAHCGLPSAGRLPGEHGPSAT